MKAKQIIDETCQQSTPHCWAYTRVSTSKQDTKVQRHEIEQYAKEHNIKIDEFVEERVSGTVDIKSRDLNKILKKAQKGDTIIVTEVSRLARTMKGILNIMCLCIDKGITLISMKENYKLNGKDPTSKLVLAVYSFNSEMERNLISQRTKEGLEAKRRAGVKLGRPNGAKNKKYRLDPHKDKIISMLNMGIPKAQIAKKLSCDSSTLYQFLDRNGIEWRRSPCG